MLECGGTFLLSLGLLFFVYGDFNIFLFSCGAVAFIFGIMAIGLWASQGKEE